MRNEKTTGSILEPCDSTKIAMKPSVVIFAKMKPSKKLSPGHKGATETKDWFGLFWFNFPLDYRYQILGMVRDQSKRKVRDCGRTEILTPQPLDLTNRALTGTKENLKTLKTYQYLLQNTEQTFFFSESVWIETEHQDSHTAFSYDAKFARTRMRASNASF